MKHHRHRTENGLILYEGPSLLDGAPIVALATGLAQPSSNEKTGPMIQTWILRADQSPTEAHRTGADASVCGDCPLRAQACYVVLARGPTAVYRSYQSSRYPHLETVGPRLLRFRSVRIGSYGDPAAVPANIWFSLARSARAYTGYTHAWRTREVQSLKSILMASVDSEAEAFEARALGWRTYRVRLADEPLLPFESVCPASDEGGRRITCHDCGQCDGARPYDLRYGYTSIAHGSGRKAFSRTRLAVLSDEMVG